MVRNVETCPLATPAQDRIEDVFGMTISQYTMKPSVCVVWNKNNCESLTWYYTDSTIFMFYYQECLTCQSSKVIC